MININVPLENKKEIIKLVKNIHTKIYVSQNTKERILDTYYTYVVAIPQNETVESMVKKAKRCSTCLDTAVKYFQKNLKTYEAEAKDEI